MWTYIEGVEEVPLLDTFCPKCEQFVRNCSATPFFLTIVPFFHEKSKSPKCSILELLVVQKWLQV